MKLPRTPLLFLIGLMLLLLPNDAWRRDLAHAHPFSLDLKEALECAKIPYDSRAKGYLFRALPVPTTQEERIGLKGRLPKTIGPEEINILDGAVTGLFRQFFKKVQAGATYCPVEEIKKRFGKGPRERLGISSGGYYNLFAAYWTLKSKLVTHRDLNIRRYGQAYLYNADLVVAFVEENLGSAFFPPPHSLDVPEALRKRGIQEMLETYAPHMTVQSLYEGADPGKVPWPVLK